MRVVVRDLANPDLESGPSIFRGLSTRDDEDRNQVLSEEPSIERTSLRDFVCGGSPPLRRISAHGQNLCQGDPPHLRGGGPRRYATSPTRSIWL